MRLARRTWQSGQNSGQRKVQPCMERGRCSLMICSHGSKQCRASNIGSRRSATVQTVVELNNTYNSQQAPALCQALADMAGCEIRRVVSGAWYMIAILVRSRVFSWHYQGSSSEKCGSQHRMALWETRYPLVRHTGRPGLSNGNLSNIRLQDSQLC